MGDHYSPIGARGANQDLFRSTNQLLRLSEQAKSTRTQYQGRCGNSDDFSDRLSSFAVSRVRSTQVEVHERTVNTGCVVFMLPGEEARCADWLEAQRS